MVLWLLLGAVALSALGQGQTGIAPEITSIFFPRQIRADGNPISGLVGFKDADGDVARADFTVIAATDFQAFTVTPDVKGQKEGAFEFQLSTRTPQRVTLRVTLTDEAGNKSAPKDFSFEAKALLQPALKVSPLSLSFQAAVGGFAPANQSLTITNAGDAPLSWRAQADSNWLTLSRTSGGPLAPNATESVMVSVNLSGLNAGQQQGRIVITAEGAQNSPATVAVALTLETRPATLQVSPSALTFRATEGGSASDSQTLQISNTGGQPLSWEATTDAPWLLLGATRGALLPGQSTDVRVFINMSGLTAGTRQGRITITGAGAQGSPAVVEVTLTVEVRPSVLQVSPSTLSFQGPAGGASPAPQTLTITNTGGGTLNWVASADPSWIQLSATTGTAPATLTVSVQAAGLSAGAYAGRITITAAGLKAAQRPSQ
ncbi:BACON domain-containing protein [Candidatus Acetothermia bacterium]|nr:BACON domain-containing protein [Candidatus Acetothermia bacterium]